MRATLWRASPYSQLEKKNNSKQDPGRLAQLGEHRPYKARVTGSSPVSSTIFQIKM